MYRERDVLIWLLATEWWSWSNGRLHVVIVAAWLAAEAERSVISLVRRTGVISADTASRAGATASSRQVVFTEAYPCSKI